LKTENQKLKEKINLQDNSDLGLKNQYLRKAFDIKSKELEEWKTKYFRIKEEVKDILSEYQKYK
jgi:hypothetical protein